MQSLTRRSRVAKNTLSLTADISHIEKMLRRAEIADFHIFCDERAFGGDGSAPEPLMYFTAAAGF